MKPAVRQMRGPGMNKGLKKPRHGQFKDPEPAKKSSAPRGAEPQSSSGERKDYSKGSSYLSGNLWK
jgi:hypothetical protein